MAVGQVRNMVSPSLALTTAGARRRKQARPLLARNGGASPLCPAVGKVTITDAQMDAIQAIVDKANAVGMRLTVADVVSVLNWPAVGKVTL